MRGDFSEHALEPVKDLTAVQAQQGSVQLDADLNEQATLSTQWLKTVDFAVSKVALADIAGAVSTQGFAMSRAEMEQALALAERMRHRLAYLVQDAKNAPYVRGPASDPASSKYIGTRSQDIRGISGADEFYRGRLNGQEEYLTVLISKLKEALAAAEAADEEAEQDFKRTGEAD